MLEAALSKIRLHEFAACVLETEPQGVLGSIV
jgi:hypothetical protein